MSKENGTYQIFDRLFFLMKTDSFRMKKYMETFECARNTAFRDLRYLRNFYDIDFQWDNRTKTYRKVKAE